MGAGLSTGLIVLLLVVGLIIIISSVGAKSIKNLLKRDKTLVEIEAAMKSRDYKSVLKHMIYAQKSKEFMPMYYMAKAFEEMGEYHNAAKCYEDCAVRLPESDRDMIQGLNYHIAENYRKEGRIREALGYYELIDRSSHLNWKVSFYIAQILCEMKNYLNAKKFIEEYLKNARDDAEALLMYGKICVHLNMYVAAIKTLNEVIESGKLSAEKNDDAKFFLAKALMAKKTYHDAEVLFKTLMDKKDIRDEVFYDIVDIKIHQNEIQGALDFYNERFAEVSQTSRDNALYEIASAMWKTGSAYEAIRLWHEIALRSPDYKDVSTILSQNQILMDNPFIENIFSKDEKSVERFLAKTFQLGKFYGMEKFGSIWYLFNDSFCYVIIREPNIVGASTFTDIEKTIKDLNLASREIFVFSIKGFVEECKDSSLYHRVSKYQDEDYVAYFKAKNDIETAPQKTET